MDASETRAGSIQAEEEYAPAFGAELDRRR